jgi:MinD-like ATPase involved in chromosome partitioning or flagellar assembly
VILCWAAKGGSGTTVVACALALGADRSQRTTLVDLSGDSATALGLAEPTGPGVADWLASPTATAADLARLAVPVRDDVRLIPRGLGAPPNDQWGRLAIALGSSPNVIVDAGTGRPPEELHAVAAHSLLVTRACFIAIRRARQLEIRPTGVVLVGEPGRALTAGDIEHAVGAPVVAEIRVDPAVARAVDAGLLTTRLPRSLITSLRSAA